jgi:transcriptional regulator PpsR
VSQRGIGDVPTPSGLGEYAPELAETFVTVASDIALVVDLDGTIRSVAVGADSPTPAAAAWVGRAWTDTVTEPTRRKIRRLLDDLAVTGVASRCEVSHLLPSGASVPIAYSAVRLGGRGPVLAAGRDLRAIAAIQQRFVLSQQQMEREFWKRREAESRYRLLFQVATDAVLIVDAATLRVLEANPAAAERLGEPPAALAGRPATALFEPAGAAIATAVLEDARAGGHPQEARLRLAGGRTVVEVAAVRFRAADATLLRIRLRAVDEAPADAPRAAVHEAGVPPAIAVTDFEGRVLMTNPAFAVLAGLAPGAGTEDRPLGDWLSDWSALLTDVRRDGFVRGRALRLRRATGEPVPVVVAAALLTDGESERFGFTLWPAEPAGA